MIDSIFVKNFAIIKEIKVDLYKGLNIFTGETGAGKSLIVESISFLFGSRYYEKDIKIPVSVSAWITLDKKAAVTLNIPLKIEVKRVYDLDRKNRYFINSKQVSFSQISEISKYVIDFHAQMENRILNSNAAQTEILDSYAHIEDKVQSYSLIYDKKKEIENKIQNLLMNEVERKKLLDLYEYQLNEIESADLKENEDIEIEDIISKAKNRSRINKMLSEIDLILSGDNGILDSIYKVNRKAEELLKFDTGFASISELSARIESYSKNLKDEVISHLSSYSVSDEQIDEYIKRDELIKSLKKKYGGDIKYILLKKEELKKQIYELKNSNENLDLLKKEIEKINFELEKKASYISDIRKKKAKELSKEIEESLKKLGFEHSVFSISIEDSEDLNPYGKNVVEFLFSSNPDHLIKPLSFVASGGELSRIMLSIKSVASKESLSKTFIFDEIDAGVGGNTAFSVGEALKKLSKTNQILSITHMPQVAVFGESHFKVEKKFENSRTNVYLKKLETDSDRIEEISRMLGSSYSPSTAVKHAKEIFEKVRCKR